MLCHLCEITAGKMIRHLQTVHRLSNAAAAIQANMWSKSNSFDEAVAAVRRTKLKSVIEAANLAEVRESLHASTRQLVQVDASASQFAEEWGRIRQFLLSDVGGRLCGGDREPHATLVPQVRCGEQLRSCSHVLVGHRRYSELGRYS